MFFAAVTLVHDPGAALVFAPHGRVLVPCCPALAPDLVDYVSTEIHVRLSSRQALIAPLTVSHGIDGVSFARSV
jgi:hypothetical protein